MPTITFDLTHKVQGIYAYAFAFDDDANIVSETEGKLFIGYCAECVRRVLAEELGGEYVTTEECVCW